MQSRRMLPAIAGALFLVALATPADADHSWGDYHWATTSHPIGLQVVDSMTPDWDPNLDGSLTEWSKSTKLDMTITSQDDAHKTRKRCQSVDGQMRVCNAAYGNNGWLGLASINIDVNGHIVRGTAKMNDSYSWYWTPEEKNHVTCQEIGHVLGLGHTSEDGTSQSTCMDYSSDPNSQWPNQHDYAQLEAIYNHTDAYDTWARADSGGGGGGGNGCNAPPGKGCNKSQGGEVPPMGTRVVKGKDFEIWVARGAQDTLWVHHVTLVPDVPHDH